MIAARSEHITSHQLRDLRIGVETPSQESAKRKPLWGTIVDLSPRNEPVDVNLVSSEDRRRLRTNHNVFNEMDNIRKQLKAGLDPVYAWEYPHAQARGLISEFASGFGNETHYHIREGKLYAPGNAIATSDALTTYAMSAGTRETADARGFLSIEQALLRQPEGTTVIQLSPPSVTTDRTFREGYGAYGFLNMFRRIGNDVLVNHIMYQEDVDLSHSSRLRGSLQKNNPDKNPRTPEDYIQEPLIFSENTISDAEITGILGLTREWKKYLDDREFLERNILQDPLVRQWLHKYVTLQVQGATSDSPEYALRAETFLIAAYNRARHLSSEAKESSDTRTSTQEQHTPQETMLDGTHMFALFASQRLQMQAGSCPINYQAQETLNSQGFITYGGIAQSFTTRELGGDIEGWLRRDCVTCPMDGCGFVSTKQRPHLYHEQEKRWVCANPQCRAHNSDIYNKVMRTV